MKKVFFTLGVLFFSFDSYAQELSLKIQSGVRPYYLIDKMKDSALKKQLLSCANKPLEVSEFSIAHRGAPLEFPEHTFESYMAAIRMGAGVMECDVTYTKDRQLVCRHDQCDLHRTSNILLTPLASKCSQGFHPFNPVTQTPASAKCCTSDITLEEFHTLEGKMDAEDPKALNLETYLKSTPSFRTDLYANDGGKLMSHAQSIVLFSKYHLKMSPEIKTPKVTLWNQENFIDAIVKEYRDAGIDDADVFLQSFKLEDIVYLIKNYPILGKNAIYLIEEFGEDFQTNIAQLAQLKALGITTIAPPIWALLSLDKRGEIIPSMYAKALKKHGFKIITWSLERSEISKEMQNAWYYQSISQAIYNNGAIMELIDLLKNRVGVEGIFSDWPASVTYYDNCMSL
jgi:glycerophosphoryl diester phosphodiesterase